LNNTARIFIPKKVEPAPAPAPVKGPQKPTRILGSVYYLCPYCRADVHVPYATSCPNCKLKFNHPEKQAFITKIEPEEFRKINKPLQPGQRPFLGPSGKKILRYQKEDLDEAINFLINS